MSQRNVEKVVGRLVLEEELRQRFGADRRRTVAGLVDEGLELTTVELEALVCLDAAALERFAQTVDRRLQQASLTQRLDRRREEGARPRGRRSEAEDR